MTKQNDSCNQGILEAGKKKNRALYKELSSALVFDIRQTIEEIKIFKKLYAQELLTSEGATQTLEILKNLEVQNERDKAEYIRLKAISISGIVT